jgi:two-component system sensor histidine kinase CreC
MVAAALLCMVLVLVGAYAAGRSIGLPITRLTLAARKIAGGDRSLPFPPPRGLEVRALTESYEEMRRELEDKRHIERMTQDLSHELKNPIASVRALAEALEDGGLADAAAGPRLVKQIQGAAARLEAILADVLVLARLEARGLNPRRPVELRRLVAECVDALAPRCAERQVEVTVEQAPGSVDTLEADSSWLARAVTNLILNAVENSPPGAQVQVALSSAGPVRELLVSNPGEVPAAVKDRLFERFVTRRQEGTGLGLAIARSVAEAHRGSLWLDEAGPPQVRLRLKLPSRS